MYTIYRDQAIRHTWDLVGHFAVGATENLISSAISAGKDPVARVSRIDGTTVFGSASFAIRMRRPLELVAICLKPVRLLNNIASLCNVAKIENNVSVVCGRERERNCDNQDESCVN
jgi:hypothetical protein